MDVQAPPSHHRTKRSDTLRGEADVEEADVAVVDEEKKSLLPCRVDVRTCCGCLAVVVVVLVAVASRWSVDLSVPSSGVASVSARFVSFGRSRAARGPRVAAAAQVRAGHMSFRQHAGDAYWLWRAKASEVAAFGPSLGGGGGSGKKRGPGGAGGFNATAARRFCAPQAPDLVMHLKVPKAASTTVFDLVNMLAPKNGFAVNSRPMYLDERRPRDSGPRKGDATSLGCS